MYIYIYIYTYTPRRESSVCDFPSLFRVFISATKAEAASPSTLAKNGMGSVIADLTASLQVVWKKNRHSSSSLNSASHTLVSSVSGLGQYLALSGLLRKERLRSATLPSGPALVSLSTENVHKRNRRCWLETNLVVKSRKPRT